jgi:aminoglycoside phosphotransferase (APT) family kinase protein
LNHGPEIARSAVADAAEWLAALHRCCLTRPCDPEDEATVSQWVEDLWVAQPHEGSRVRHIGEAVIRGLSEPMADTVFTHGDFQPMNIFIDACGRISAISVEKFARRERESDVGLFLMHAAALGFVNSGVFEATLEARREFCRRYEAAVGRPVQARRVGLYMAQAFLKNLHLELVLRKTNRTEFTDPWLSGAAAGALHEDIHLSA